MNSATLEHINLTVSSPKRTAKMLSTLFDWQVRWEGPAINDGYTIHIGTENQYVALYESMEPRTDAGPRNNLITGLNHIGIVVEDLDAAETRVLEAGYQPFSHADYEPGRRFYFLDQDKVEYEIISYAAIS